MTAFFAKIPWARLMRSSQYMYKSLFMAKFSCCGFESAAFYRPEVTLFSQIHSSASRGNYFLFFFQNASCWTGLFDLLVAQQTSIFIPQCEAVFSRIYGLRVFGYSSMHHFNCQAKSSMRASNHSR